MVAHGLEALEQRFGESALKYWDAGRKPLV
jgi:hypothetical protein